MDDIDKTFNRLKKLDYNNLVSKLGGLGPVTNLYTFEPEYTRHSEPICIENGWTLEELNHHVKTEFRACGWRPLVKQLNEGH
jgi:hypothetical protein